jgi:hypothetical protein
MKLNYGNLLDNPQGVEEYVADSQGNYFEQFAEDYVSRINIDDYDYQELLDEIKEAFIDHTLEVIKGDLKIVLAEIKLK